MPSMVFVLQALTDQSPLATVKIREGNVNPKYFFFKIDFNAQTCYELYSHNPYYKSYSQMPSMVFVLQALTDQSPLATVVCPTSI